MFGLRGATAFDRSRWIYRRSRWVTAFAPLFISTSMPVPVPTGAPLDLARYRLTFAEEFDALDVSSRGPGTRWIAHTPWNGDFGDARFVGPGPRGPFHVERGILTITMRRGPDGRWTSGLLASADAHGHGFTQAGGYFEMRARLPEGAGVWPAFWLAGIQHPSGIRPEVDAIEFYGHSPGAYYVNTHLWRDGRDLAHASARIAIDPGSASAEFHLYGVAIDPNHITFYRDRRMVAELPSQAELQRPMMLLVNLAAGGGWPVSGMADTSTMQVDYVRAYAARDPGART